MKYFLALVICSSPTIISNHATAQQTVSPDQNKPTTYVPQSHNFTYPINNYQAGIKPNFHREWDMEVPVEAGTPQTISTTNARVKTIYVDGFNRPIQQVERKASDDDEDIVTLNYYDKLGRSPYTMLPYSKTSALSTGLFDFDPISGLNGSYNPVGTVEKQEPFAKTEFDNSPLNRVTKNLNAGYSWVGSNRGASTYYTTNIPWITITTNPPSSVTITGGYPRWKIGPSPQDLPTWTGDYESNELVGTLVIDEDGNSSETFLDRSGKKVISRVNSGTTGKYPTDYAYTCYVYDDFGRLRCVIPPTGATLQNSGSNYTWSVNQTQFQKLCFVNNYDFKGRLVEQRTPGAESKYIVYDNWDRPVLTQDGLQRASLKWAFTVYNTNDDPIMTGMFSYSDTRDALQTIMDNNPTPPSPSLFYYLKSPTIMDTYPSAITDCDIYTQTFYSQYDFPQLAGFYFTEAYPQSNLANYLSPFKRSLRCDGLVTGTRIRILDASNPTLDKWITSVNYYSDKGKMIQQQKKNHKEGLDILSNQFTFRGDLSSSTIDHRNPDALIMPEASGLVSMDYFKRNKVMTNYKLNIATNGNIWQRTQSINDGPTFTIGSYEYNRFKKVKTKNLAGFNVFFDYNIQNKITGIRSFRMLTGYMDPCFSEQIYYNTGFGSRLYNGNIAGIIWQNSSTAPTRFYGYSYDKLNRLTHAEFGQSVNAAPFSKSEVDYTVSNITYDLNGNIKTMKQMGVGGTNMMPLVMDNLTYNYYPNSNQLAQVIDNGDNNTTLPDFKDLSNSSSEYHYDSNGNETSDDNRGLGQIVYNLLNKPTKMVLTGKGEVTFVYDALGNKLQKKVFDIVQNKTTTFDYLGNFTYKDNILQYFSTDEGRCRPFLYFSPSTYGNEQTTQINYAYDYFLKDHMSNIRQTVTTEPTIRKYIATHEIAAANVEQLVFDNIDLVRDIKPGSTDPQDLMAAHLVADDPEKRIGTAILLKVMPGDEFEISASGYHEESEENNEQVPAEEVISSLISALTGGITYSGVPMSELPQNVKTVQQLLGNDALPGMLSELVTQNESVTAPKSFINYLFFDERMKLMPANSGRVQIGETPNTWNVVGPQDAIKAKDPGFLVVFLDNASVSKPVWWDRLVINYSTGRIIGEDHYYPFGLTLSQESANPSEANNFKFSSKELSRNLFVDNNGNKSGFELYDFDARTFDPRIGRWLGVDPLASQFYTESPYAYAGNNPVAFIDLGGKLKFANQKTENNYKANYPAFTAYVMQNYGNDVMKSDFTKTGFKAIAGYKSDAALRKDVSYSTTSGPELVITPNPGGIKDGARARGRYVSEKAQVEISSFLVNQFEHAMKTGDEKTQKAALMSLFRELNHEVTHHGDYTQNPSNALPRPNNDSYTTPSGQVIDKISKEPGDAMDKYYSDGVAVRETVTADPEEAVKDGSEIEVQQQLIDLKEKTEEGRNSMPTLPTIK